MPKYLLTSPAKSSLRKIGKYTEENWGISQRKIYMKSFYECFDRLVQSPMIGNQRNGISTGLRSYNHQKHVIFYKIDKNNNILIADILHERMYKSKWL